MHHFQDLEAFKPPKQSDNKQNSKNESVIRVYVTLKTAQDENKETNKKLILMTSTNNKISMLKRLIEQEYADLFPNEPTFICAKLQDEYGYSLSNSSFVHELLQNHARLFAVPEGFSVDLTNPQAMHLTNDPQELLFLLQSIQQSISSKMTECRYPNIENLEEILAAVLPLGFNTRSKIIVHNVAQCIKKILETERLYIFDRDENAIIFNLLITILNFWIGDLIFQDSILLSVIVEILEVLIKSANICGKLKTPIIINSLMNVSKLEMASAQTRSRIIRIISYLTRGDFTDSYNPRPLTSAQTINLRQQQRNQQSQQQRSNGFRQQQQQYSNNNNMEENYIPDFQSRQPRPVSVQQAENQKQQTQNQRDSFNNISNNYSRKVENMGSEYRNKQNREFLQQNQPFEPSQSQNREYNNRNTQQQGYEPYLSKQNRNDMNNGQKKQAYPNTYSGSGNNHNTNDIDIQSDLNHAMMRDYVSLLVPESTQDMHIFAVTNLGPVIDQIINYVMESPQAYSQLLNLLEIQLPYEQSLLQLKILEVLSKNLNPTRAQEGLHSKLIARILKAFSFQPSQFQPILFDLLQKHLQYGDFSVDVPSVMELIKCGYDKLQLLGMKILTVVSDPNKAKFQNYDVQFENYIKEIIDYTYDNDKTYEFINLALQTLSNLALKDSLRAQINYNKGIEMFLAHLRNNSNIDGQRVAAKALLNCSIGSRDIKMKIVGELQDEIRRMHRNEIDSIVHGYLQTLIVSKDNAKIIY